MLLAHNAAQNRRLYSARNADRCRRYVDRSDARFPINDHRLAVVHREPVCHVATLPARVSIERSSPPGEFVPSYQYAARIRLEDGRERFNRRVAHYEPISNRRLWLDRRIIAALAAPPGCQFFFVPQH